jgi:hypothetical protein
MTPQEEHRVRQIVRDAYVAFAPVGDEPASSRQEAEEIILRAAEGAGIEIARRVRHELPQVSGDEAAAVIESAQDEILSEALRQEGRLH